MIGISPFNCNQPRILWRCVGPPGSAEKGLCWMSSTESSGSTSNMACGFYLSSPMGKLEHPREATDWPRICGFPSLFCKLGTVSVALVALRKPKAATLDALALLKPLSGFSCSNRIRTEDLEIHREGPLTGHSLKQPCGACMAGWSPAEATYQL